MASLVLPELSFWWSGDRKAGDVARSCSSICFSQRGAAVARCCFNQISPRARARAKAKASPWLMLPTSWDGIDLVYNFYSLAQNRVVSFNKGNESESMPDDRATVMGMSHGWLIYYNIDHVREGEGSMFLSNPVSGRHIKLPYISQPMDVHNVIISSHDPDDQNCRALMIYGEAYNMAFCCPARSSHWTTLGGGGGYCSSVYSSPLKLFFCISRNDDGGIEAWDLHRLDSPKKMFPVWVDKHNYPVSCSSKTERRAKPLFVLSKSLALADDSDHLYQVRRFMALRLGPDGSHVPNMYFGQLFDPHACLYKTNQHFVPHAYPYKTTHFDVYKYDTHARTWKFLDYFLDGMAIFVGKNHGFALSAAEYPDLKPDAIYFTDIAQDPYFQRIGGGHDLGIFDYRNKIISPCYYPCDYWSIKKIFPPPLWYTPQWI